MRFKLWAVGAALAFALCVGLAMPGVATAAGNGGADLSIEYCFNRITNGDGLNMPLGAAASLGLKLNDAFALAGDIRWNRKSEGDETFNLMSFQAGPRFLFHGDQASPYIQVLAGGTRASDGGSETKFSVMPGAGVDIKVSGPIRIRLGADFRLVFTEGEKEKDLMAHGGLVFNFGGK
jgi:hypothetical protein